MKKVSGDKIINIDNTELFDRVLLFECLNTDYASSETEVFFMGDLLKEKKNTSLYNELNGKYAMYSEVFSPKDELAIFESLFEYAVTTNKKIHIIGITLKEELDILEDYYIKSGFLREDVNCFKINFKDTLVTVSVNIENLIWKGSDYKSQKEKIYFVPPIRESGQNKAMYKGINRGSIAGIYFKEMNKSNIQFLEDCIKEEKILPMTLAKVINNNLVDIGFNGVFETFKINY